MDVMKNTMAAPDFVEAMRRTFLRAIGITVLWLCGGLLGIVAATVSVHPFVAFWPGELPRAQETHIDWRVLCFAMGISKFASAHG